MDIKKNFGKRIREIRTGLGLTQEQLAEQINMSSKSLSQVELGNNFVSAEALDLICKALNVQPKILFDFDYIESDKKSLIDDVVSKAKSNPQLLKTLHKIAVALDS